MDKKQFQLGMNPSTANHRLRMDILYRLAMEAGHKCFRCGGSIDRASFSIEHKEPWLDSHDPKAAFFDQDNIAFSHLVCNISEARRYNKVYESAAHQQRASVRRHRELHGRQYDAKSRHEKWIRNGT
jgi:hypothetical protein